VEGLTVLPYGRVQGRDRQPFRPLWRHWRRKGRTVVAGSLVPSPTGRAVVETAVAVEEAPLPTSRELLRVCVTAVATAGGVVLQWWSRSRKPRWSELDQWHHFQEETSGWPGPEVTGHQTSAPGDRQG